MTLVRFRENGDATYVSFKYAPDVVALIKDSIPAQLRSFDPEFKMWTVPTIGIDRLKAAVADLGHEVEGVVPRPKPPPGATVEFFDDDRAAAEATAKAILESVIPRMRGAVFRAMARELYPDLYRRGR